MRIAKAILFLYAVVYRKAASGSFLYCQMNRKETVTSKCLKRWRLVNPAKICYTDTIIDWGTFYAYVLTGVPRAVTLTMADIDPELLDALNSDCRGVLSEGVSNTHKHLICWVSASKDGV